MDKKNFSFFLLALLLLGNPAALAAQQLASEAEAETAAYDQTEAAPFIKDSNFKATLYYFQRYRDRYDLNPGHDHYQVNLSHATMQASLDFESGYFNELIGFDFGVFGSVDMYNKGDPGHEMNFFPSRDPWTSYGSAARAKDSASVYKAAVKIKNGPFRAKAGYFQPSVPGVLGVNWSFLPGTYQGVEIGADFDRLSLGASWANQYKAPWYTETYKFKKNDKTTGVDYLWSLGARYKVTDKLSLEAAYGESQNYMWNAHFKAKYLTDIDVGERFYLTWQSYFINDLQKEIGTPNDNFSSMALQQYLATRYERGPWAFNLDFLYTRAPNARKDNAGYFSYRLTSRYGSSKGAYEPWWDLRSDWNHHDEKAVFVKASRKLDDLGLEGLEAGLSFAEGWGAKAWGYSGSLKESAFGADLKYKISSGRMEGTVFALHYTQYRNHTDLPSWKHFNNAFQNEHDIKFSVVVPLNFLSHK